MDILVKHFIFIFDKDDLVTGFAYNFSAVESFPMFENPR